MRRQQLRKLLLIVSFLLFPITIFYFSPYLIIGGLAEGIIAGCLFIFVTQLCMSLIVGRAFCGWLCPAGGQGEICTSINGKRVNRKYRFIKWIIWIPWIGIIVFLMIKNHGILKSDFFYETIHGISVAQPGNYIIYYGVVFLIFILSVIYGRRAFCHYVCWMAPFMIIDNRIRKSIPIPSLKLDADKDSCVHCKKCTNRCPMSLPVEKMVTTNNMLDNDCILCGECIDVCPKSVIKYSFRR